MFFLNPAKQSLSRYALCAALAFAGMSLDAKAADFSGSEQTPEPDFDGSRFKNDPPEANWSLIIGAGAMLEPEYEGSDKFEIGPLPIVLFTYGQWLEIDPRGVTVKAFERDGFSLSGKIGYETGRDEDDADELEGLGDIDFAATVGLKAAYEWGPLEIYASIDQTIDGSESLIGKVGAEYTAPITEQFILGAGVEATIANDKHMEAYFGVNAAQSARSGLPEYDAGAGLKRVDFSASATYLINEHWLVRGQAGVGVLTGDAADSPIVKEKVQPSTSLFVGYKF